MRASNGEPCRTTATHCWGKVHFCCAHFDLFIAAIFDLKDAVIEMRHESLVRILEHGNKHGSRIPGAECEVGHVEPDEKP